MLRILPRLERVKSTIIPRLAPLRLQKRTFFSRRSTNVEDSSYWRIRKMKPSSVVAKAGATSPIPTENDCDNLRKTKMSWAETKAKKRQAIEEAEQEARVTYQELSQSFEGKTAGKSVKFVSSTSSTTYSTEFSLGPPEELTDVKDIERRAAAGDTAAITRLALILEEGVHLPGDKQTAVRLLQKAAEKGNPRAQSLAIKEAAVLYSSNPFALPDPEALLAMKHHYGSEHVAQSLSEAVRLYQLAAQASEPLAQLGLATLHQEGTGVPHDTQEAARLYAAAAEAGLAPAQYALGMMFQYGSGEQEEEDREEACRLFTLSAESKFAPALYELALCYKSGAGTEANPEEAYRLFNKAGLMGHIEAQYEEAVCLLEGSGTEQDVGQAVGLLETLAESGHPAAQHQVALLPLTLQLGLCYQDGGPLEHDPARAVSHFRLAADQDYPPAQFELGMCLMEGDGVQQDTEAGLRLAAQAADAGEPRAQCLLGLHQVKHGDAGRGVAYLEAAARMGLPEAQFVLSNCYRDGTGVDRDDEKASFWLQQAEEQGYSGKEPPL